MCGIAGIISETGGDLSYRMQPLIDAQRHRGPDAWGIWADDRCVLGHRRLSIIDLSDAGRQPLSNEDGTIWITYNGEIYNFQAQRYGHWVGYFGEAAKQRLYRREVWAQLNGDRSDHWFASLCAETRDLDPSEAAMAIDVQSYLPYDLLVKVDITSMANSLEVRSPFLDHEVMEFAARLPVELKLRGRRSKYLLKRAFADLLPSENVHRRKMGFGVPVGAWFLGPLRPLLEDALLSEQTLRWGYFQPEALRRLVTEHLERRADHSFSLWNLLMLELWHREFIDRR
jgi:asparagine synthase (glutamine-hydrolysing)